MFMATADELQLAQLLKVAPKACNEACFAFDRQLVLPKAEDAPAGLAEAARTEGAGSPRAEDAPAGTFFERFRNLDLDAL